VEKPVSKRSLTHQKGKHQALIFLTDSHPPLNFFFCKDKLFIRLRLSQRNESSSLFLFICGLLKTNEYWQWKTQMFNHYFYWFLPQ